jgi:hypothetical protein
MKAEQALLRIGEHLVARACRRLPGKTREDRYQEWTAELPAILHDPEIRFAPLRAVRMLGYAADTLRGAARAPGSARRRSATLSALWSRLVFTAFIAGLVFLVLSVQDAVRAPGDWVDYVDMALSLSLMAWAVSHYLRPSARTTRLISEGTCLAGLVYYSCHAVQSPGDWLNYVLAVFFFLSLLFWLIWPGGASVRRNAGTESR